MCLLQQMALQDFVKSVEIEIVFFAIDAQRYRDRALNPVRGYRFFRDGGGGMSRSRCKDG